MSNQYEWCSEIDKSDKSFLGFIYTRLQIKGDSVHQPHMKRLDSIIKEMSGKISISCDCSVADECPQGKRGVQSRCRIWKE